MPDLPLSLGFIAVVENEKLVGYNVAVGGGMGRSHGNEATYPRLADVIGFIPDRIRSQSPDSKADEGYGDGDTDEGALDDGSDDEGTIREGFAEQRLRPQEVQLRPKMTNPPGGAWIRLIGK